jgi:hypothetical protein
MHRLTLLAIMLLGARTTVATPLTLLCESHAGAAPSDAQELVEAVRHGLGAPAVIYGHGFDVLVADRVSRPAGAADLDIGGVVRNRIIDIQEDVIRGRFEEAVARMERLQALIRDSPAAVAAEPKLRKALFGAGLVTLKALLRLRRQGDAESLGIEISRDFPDFVVTERDHGPEVFSYVTDLRRRGLPRAAYGITVETAPEGAAVFVNERYVGHSPVRVGELMPGRYRVMARSGSGTSRVHSVAILEGSADVRIDLAYDQALGPRGFQFADDADRARREAPYALRLARALGAREVITVGVGGPAERPLWIGTVYNVDSGGILRSAAVALTPTPPPRALVVALGRFLRAGAPAEGLIVARERPAALPAATPAAPEEPPRSGLRLWSYAGLVVAAALVGTGAYLVHLDGKGTCDLQPGQQRCLEDYHTLGSGAGVLAGGAVLAAAAGTLLYLDVRRGRARVGVAFDRRGAGLATLSGAF